MSKNVLIVQNYNINKGDTSVVQAMKESLNEAYPELKIYLTSYEPEKAEKEYGVKSARWLLDYSLIKKSNSFFKKACRLVNEAVWLVYSWIWAHLFSLNVVGRNYIPAKRKKTIDFYLDADAVILPGGHFFTTLNRFPVVFSHYYSMWFAHKLGKQTMIYAQTIGPFNGFFGKISYLLTKNALRFCDKVTVREADSLRYDILDKMILTGESVFLKKNAQEGSEAISKYRDKDKLVGITIHHIYYSQFFSRSEYVQIMGNLLNKVISKYGYDVLFIPMESFRNEEAGDRKMIEDIRSQIDKKDKTKVVKGDLSPEETEELISAVDVFIGTKTHSIVYGLKNCVPTISIAYQEKSNEFMKSFNVRENSIDLKSLNENKFMAIFDRVANNLQKYSEIQESALNGVIKSARLNNDILFDLVK